jgi:cytochrome c-type biogenesis protein CcmH
VRSELPGPARASTARAAAVCCLLLGLALLGPAGAAWAQESTTSQREVVEIARTLKCPVCESQSVADSPSQLAQEMRAYIQRRLDAGDSRQAIVQALVDRYGEGILLEPPRTGFTLLVWWLPVLSLALGAVVVALALRRWTRPAAAALGAEPVTSDLSPEEVVHYRARLAEELARRERGAG